MSETNRHTGKRTDQRTDQHAWAAWPPDGQTAIGIGGGAAPGNPLNLCARRSAHGTHAASRRVRQRSSRPFPSRRHDSHHENARR